MIIAKNNSNRNDVEQQHDVAMSVQMLELAREFAKWQQLPICTITIRTVMT